MLMLNMKGGRVWIHEFPWHLLLAVCVRATWHKKDIADSWILLYWYQRIRIILHKNIIMRKYSTHEYHKKSISQIHHLSLQTPLWRRGLFMNSNFIAFHDVSGEWLNENKYIHADCVFSISFLINPGFPNTRLSSTFSTIQTIWLHIYTNMHLHRFF